MIDTTTIELLKAATAGIAALLSGIALFQVQQGSLRRRRRRVLIEELELFDKLVDWPEVQERQRIVVNHLAGKHLPAGRVRETTPRWVWLFSGVGAGLIAALVSHDEPQPIEQPFPVLVVISVVVGGVIGGLLASWDHRKWWWERLL